MKDSKKGGQAAKAGSKAGSKLAKAPKRKIPPSDPTKDAPFKVDVNDDGDFASPRRDLSEDELKDLEDRRS